jgi:hypothetical protein
MSCGSMCVSGMLDTASHVNTIVLGHKRVMHVHYSRWNRRGVLADVYLGLREDYN